ncbi:MAG: class I SAM-dependent methyltransferase [Anaerolineales bacterium]|nr:class I SAM-dependent methyltransferase [Anaerolineales bacterium]
MNIPSEELFKFLIQEAQAHFSGWDFSYLAGRESEAPLRWSYISDALLRVRKSTALLDMDTGGGETFARFAPFPPVTYATEAYAPNVPIARERLEPLGVQVVALAEEEPRHLPFESNCFDLVLNRHGYYWAAEVYRITQPGGVFLTQQVGNRNDIGIRELLGAPDAGVIEECDDLGKAVRDLQKAGFRVIKQLEDLYPQRFYDVGALVYQLKAVPWQIPDFSIEGYFQRLQDIHAQIQREGFVDVIEHRFFILAEKG